MYDTALLVLRLVVGLYIAAHGAQKLFGWFGGTGLQATIDGFEGRLHLRPAPLWGILLSISETMGGSFMALGLLGPIGPVATAGAMLGAVVFGHWSRGPWGSKGGYELPATNLAVALAVALLGVGRFSADAVLGLSVPQSVDLVFGILVLLGVVAAAFSRGPRQQASGGVVS